MRRFALLLLAGASSLLAASPRTLGAQGFGVYEHNSCAMGRAGVTAARPCADGSAIYFNPAGLAGLPGSRLSGGVTAIAAKGGFTDDFLNHRTDLDNPTIPVPNFYFTRQLNPNLTVGLGAYAPYGLETKWPLQGFEGRFMAYNTDIRSIYIQPTLGYQVSPTLKIGIGFAYITSRLELHQRQDLSAQPVPAALAVPAGLPAGTTFGMLGVPRLTDFADATLEATGTGYAVNFGAIIKVNDRLSIGGHWLTRKHITYDGDAVFEPVGTGLVVPDTIGVCPACIPSGTPVDAVLGPQFLAGGALEDGPVSTQGTLGFAYKISDSWSFMADWQYVVWGWFSEVAIDFENPATPDLTLHPSNKDTHGARFGTEYQYSPKVQLRAGYLYHGGASPANFVTPLLPEGPRNEFTIGAGIEMTPKLHVDLAYQYIKQNDRRGTVNTSVGNTGLYQFSANLFGVGLAYTF
jgi:long-chain fatty acid transport protein